MHTFDRPLYPKNNKYLKKRDDVAGSVKSMQCGYSLKAELNSTSNELSLSRNLSKTTRRYVKNTNKKNSFLLTNMSIQPLWLTHFIEIVLVPEFQLTKFIVGTFSYKVHFRPQISSNDCMVSVHSPCL